MPHIFYLSDNAWTSLWLFCMEFLAKMVKLKATSVDMGEKGGQVYLVAQKPAHRLHN